MEKINDGGPAFPSTEFKALVPDSFSYQQKAHIANFVHSIPTNGMSMRDYFAGQALASITTRAWEENGKVPDDIFDRWAKASYATADAMLRARGQ